MKKQPIAIIGGMGPEASVYLYNTMIKQSIAIFHAVNNDDFPEILLYSIPVPDFISTNEKRHEALEILKEKVENMNLLNPLCYAIACNTAHVLIDELQRVAISPFTSIVDEVVKEVSKSEIKKIGLLGTPSTLKSNIYQDTLSDLGIKSVVPTSTEIEILEKIIRKVIAGTTEKSDINKLIKIANRLIEDGAEGIILGCTELPLVFPDEYSFPVYNSIEIISKTLLEKYYSQSGS